MGRPDDHVVLLLHKGETVARFSQSGATEEGIQAECARHLTLHHHWNGCMEQKRVSGKKRKKPLLTGKVPGKTEKSNVKISGGKLVRLDRSRETK